MSNEHQHETNRRGVERGLDDPWSLLWVPAALLAQAVVVVPIWFIVGLWIGLSCGTTVNQPCDDLAERALVIWSALLGVVFVASAVLTWFRHIMWLVLPIPAAVAIGSWLILLWELSQR